MNGTEREMTHLFLLKRNGDYLFTTLTIRLGYFLPADIKASTLKTSRQPGLRAIFFSEINNVRKEKGESYCIRLTTYFDMHA